jgi:hypothetical protein
MNVIEFKSSNQNIAYCLVDYTSQYESAWTRELTKNLADFNISNITGKGYTVLQGYHEEQLLKKACDLGFKHAVIFSTGTEFINGDAFFDEVENISITDYFIAGHVLDRGDAYYELHRQCYIVNLQHYKILDYPAIGKQELGAVHTQDVPWRSFENWHDNYTPKTISGGDQIKQYNHKCHGWNILKVAFEKGLTVLVFDNNIRNNKKHYYPENQTEFLKHSTWLYARQNYCYTEFVHTSNTDQSNEVLTGVEYVFTPASGIWWVDYISKTKPVEVVMYDYNQKALDYWTEHAPAIANVTYSFVKLDLLIDDPVIVTDDKLALINLSNIFAYEATAPFYSLEYRLNRENKLLSTINTTTSNSYVSFSTRAATGFINAPLFGKNLHTIKLADLTQPSWHYGDWL